MKPLKMILANIKPAVVGLVVLSTIAAPVFTSCEKDKPLVQHDTYLTFGVDHQNEIFPPEKLQAHIDSAEVRNIYIISDGEYWGGMSTTAIRIGLLEQVFSMSSKIKSGGELGEEYAIIKGVTTREPADSLWLVDHKYKIIPFIHPNNE